ncbi:hypothetical protein, partial [Actinacidiphila sp. bgisy167]|uniref:hypothetical protein n=1 Tax=Actinacidiphila sp. bgisy167 TaxID=3413797 RepID=UPI003D711B70
MKIAMWALVCLALLWTVIPGVAALTAGRVLAFRPDRVLRPALWGTGRLCLAAGAVLAGLMSRFTVAVGDVLGGAVLVCLLAHALFSRRSRQ